MRILFVLTQCYCSVLVNYALVLLQLCGLARHNVVSKGESDAPPTELTRQQLVRLGACATIIIIVAPASNLTRNIP